MKKEIDSVEDYAVHLNIDDINKADEVINIINNHPFKAMVFYLVPNDEEPQQPLLEILKNMAKQSYLCFVCQESDKWEIGPIDQNIYKISKDLYLISVVRSLAAIVLCTQDLDPTWTEILPHKYIWYHHQDNQESPTFKNSLLLKQADMITTFKNQIKNADRRKWLYLIEEAGNDNTEKIEENIKSSAKGWTIYANIDIRGKVAVMTATFLDFEGDYFYCGGAERYLLDLSEICEELNREMVIFQYGNYPWVRRFKNIDVISLSRGRLRLRVGY